MSLLSSHSFYNGRNFDFSFSVDTDCHKRRQTSCPVVRVEVQTGCYFEANSFDDHRLLGAVCCLYNSEALLELKVIPQK